MLIGEVVRCMMCVVLNYEKDAWSTSLMYLKVV